MPDEDHDKERVIIESSIIAVTLLFIVADLRGMLGEQGAVFVGLLSGVSLFFVIAALLSTAALFDLASKGPFWVAFGGLFFGLGLAVLVLVILLLTAAGLGPAFSVVLTIVGILTATLIVVLALALVSTAWRAFSGVGGEGI